MGRHVLYRAQVMYGMTPMMRVTVTRAFKNAFKVVARVFKTLIAKKLSNQITSSPPPPLLSRFPL
jgi:hypothetical protein